MPLDFSLLPDDGIDGNLPILDARRRARQLRARRWGPVLVLSALAAAIWLPTSIDYLQRLDSAQPTIVALLVAAVGAAVTAVFALGFVILGSLGPRLPAPHPRLEEFARSNGLGYQARGFSPLLPGSHFSGRHRKGPRVSDLVVDPAGRFEFANYQVRDSHPIGYVAILLDRPLPHIVLDARPLAERGATFFARDLASHQLIHLEGDFPSTFAVYAPTGYGADARYVLTPDLMALLVDEVGNYSVEIVDEWMFVYSWHPFSDDAELIRRIFSIIDVVGSRAHRRSSRYSDARSSHTGLVDGGGQRLELVGHSRRDRLWIVAVIAVTIGIFVVPLVAIELAR